MNAGDQLHGRPTTPGGTIPFGSMVKKGFPAAQMVLWRVRPEEQRPFPNEIPHVA